MYLDTPITPEQLQAIEPAYYVMNFQYIKQFANVVNVVGLEVLTSQQEYYKMLLEDKAMGNKKREYEKHLAMKKQLKMEQEELQAKMKSLNKAISSYEDEHRRSSR